MLDLFLSQMKAALARSTSLVIWQRPKNKETMEQLEFTAADVKETLSSLRVLDSLGPPEADDQPGRPGTVALFAPWLGEPSRQVYVKVRLVPTSVTSVECVSFHFPEAELRLK